MISSRENHTHLGVTTTFPAKRPVLATRVIVLHSATVLAMVHHELRVIFTLPNICPIRAFRMIILLGRLRQAYNGCNHEREKCENAKEVRHDCLSPRIPCKLTVTPCVVETRTKEYEN